MLFWNKYLFSVILEWFSNILFFFYLVIQFSNYQLPYVSYFYGVSGELKVTESNLNRVTKRKISPFSKKTNKEKNGKQRRYF